MAVTHHLFLSEELLQGRESRLCLALEQGMVGRQLLYQSVHLSIDYAITLHDQQRSNATVKICISVCVSD